MFLSKRASVDRENQTLAYAMMLAVKVPDYEIDRVFWPNGHFEGADLYRDTAFLEVTPPRAPAAGWDVKYWWASAPDSPLTKTMQFASASATDELTMKFANNSRPGISGQLRLVVRPWA